MLRPVEFLSFAGDRETPPPGKFFLAGGRSAPARNLKIRRDADFLKAEAAPGAASARARDRSGTKTRRVFVRADSPVAAERRCAQNEFGMWTILEICRIFGLMDCFSINRGCRVNLTRGGGCFGSGEPGGSGLFGIGAAGIAAGIND
jgi:hypothetical protein